MERENILPCRSWRSTKRFDALSDLLHTGEKYQDTSFLLCYFDDMTDDGSDELLH